MVESVLFIGAIIAGVTQAVKSVLPEVRGWITILIALLAGVLVAVVDTSIGVENITIATGVMTAFGTVGVFAAAEKI